MWYLPDDTSRPVITAQEQINSAARRGKHPHLPKTALIFFMSKGIEHLIEHHGAQQLPEEFPCFLNRKPVWVLPGTEICLLHGGAGAPQAADTVETLRVLGVENVVTVGLFGAFVADLRPGDVVVPEKVFVEEGTTLHYCGAVDFSEPDPEAHRLAAALPGVRTDPLVSTDAVYRQTFRKEQLWRDEGAVGVDMETSAVFSVARCLGMRAVGLLAASDVHPLSPDDPKWAWHMTDDMRANLTERALQLAKALAGQK